MKAFRNEIFATWTCVFRGLACAVKILLHHHDHQLLRRLPLRHHLHPPPHLRHRLFHSCRFCFSAVVVVVCGAISFRPPLILKGKSERLKITYSLLRLFITNTNVRSRHFTPFLLVQSNIGQQHAKNTHVILSPQLSLLPRSPSSFLVVLIFFPFSSITLISLLLRLLVLPNRLVVFFPV